MDNVQGFSFSFVALILTLILSARPLGQDIKSRTARKPDLPITLVRRLHRFVRRILAGFNPRITDFTSRLSERQATALQSRPLAWYADRVLNQMTRDFFDPTPEQQNIVLIDSATLQKHHA